MGIQERKERERMMRREQILDAAEKLFFGSGSEQATMDNLAEAAELSKGTLYLYFRSKEDIHYAITQRGIEHLYASMKERVDPTKGAVDNLLILADEFVRFVEKDVELASSILFFQACELHKLNVDQEQISKDFLERSPIQLVIDFVERGVSAGEIRSDIPAELIGHTLWSQLMGVIQVSKNKKELFELVGISKEAILDSHIKIVLDGLKT